MDGGASRQHSLAPFTQPCSCMKIQILCSFIALSLARLPIHVFRRLELSVAPHLVIWLKHAARHSNCCFFWSRASLLSPGSRLLTAGLACVNPIGLRVWRPFLIRGHLHGKQCLNRKHCLKGKGLSLDPQAPIDASTEGAPRTPILDRWDDHR